MTIEWLKKTAAEAALAYVQPGQLLGIGTGSTVSYFIEALATSQIPIKGVVSSSQASTRQLQALGMPLVDSNQVTLLDSYIDGADEVNPDKQLIKGGGAALTGEKIIAAMARHFICIVDHQKQVSRLGRFPLPVEIIPLAREYVVRELVKLGGNPVYRQGVVTDYGNMIIDVHRLTMVDPCALEQQINSIAGVVTVGLFAHRGADTVVVGTSEGVKIIV
jgi:ribose 5-phosphate isomerase A